MIVVDASAVLEVLLRTGAAGLVERRLLQRGETLHAPELLDVEVVQALRRYQRRRELTTHRGGEALETLGVFPIVRYSHRPLLSRMWQLRENLTAYDAAYVALAEALAAPLVTRDARLAGAPGHSARVEWIRHRE